MPQRYGEQKEWEEHFNYLLPFFKDERYIKINNKPAMLIYRTEIIDCLEPMIAFFNDKVREHGWDGLTFISQHPSSERSSSEIKKEVSYHVLFEPINSYQYSSIAQEQKDFEYTGKPYESDFE